MNIIPKNYISKLSLKETQEAQELIRDLIKQEVMDVFELSFARAPKISTQRPTVNFFSEEGKRVINFDSANDNNIYYLPNHYNFWLVKTLTLLELKNNNGVASFINYIDRDLEITNTASMEVNTLQIEYRFDNKEIAIGKAKDLGKLIYNIILRVQANIQNKYKKLNTKLPKNIMIKELSKISGSQYPEDAKIALVNEQSAFFLLKQWKINDRQSFNKTFELSLETYSKETDKSFTLVKIKDRKTLEDMEPYSTESEKILEEYMFAKEQLGEISTRSINISLNIDLISMVILEKVHILELQAGENSETIEKLFQAAHTKHL